MPAANSERPKPGCVGAMTCADLASSSIAASAGSMPLSACSKRSGRPAPRSIRSVRRPCTTSVPAALSAGWSIPSPGLFIISGLFYHVRRGLPLRAAQGRSHQSEGLEMTDGVTIHSGVTYANHDGVELPGDLYLPKDAKAAPALVAVHGGGWVQGVRGAFQYWGPYLAARGIATFAISYRLAAKAKTFPQAVQDVLAGVQFLRGK